jgi:hypothetical protein
MPKSFLRFSAWELTRDRLEAKFAWQMALI